MDKSWMTKSLRSQDYIKGVDKFVEFASLSQNSSGKILCPCKTCINRYFHFINDVKEHLISKGIFTGYVVWNRHGEDHCVVREDVINETFSVTNNIEEASIHAENPTTDDIDGLLRDTFGANDLPTNLNGDQNDCHTDQPDVEDIRFTKLMEDAGAELYPGCKSHSKLSFILHLFRLKCLNSWTARSFDMLLELLIDAFPAGSLLPKNTYEVKKLMKAFDLGYIKIDACPNDCMIFWKDRADQEVCHICGCSRWATPTKKITVGKKTQMKSAKIVRYFPLIPRLQRLFKTKQSAEEMVWHAKFRNIDGLLRHPADGEAWKAFDSRYPDFAAEPRNIRLGLASDGFNPFKILSSTYSIWPVLLVPYNMPPWIGMKQNSFILSTIIPGDKSPGNDIDVYLQPLIQELCELWHGVPCFDAATGQKFNMRATLLWTINDFPAYGMLSGWSTKGRFACPCCAQQTQSLWLYKGKKFSYMGHRRWLPNNHIFRYQKHLFDNTDEVRHAPRRITGTEILAQVQNMHFLYGKLNKAGGKRGQDIWKKKSIFFSLPYWEFNLLPHNLDVMHIEKNICDNFIATLLDLDKSKDNLQARQDLIEIGLKNALHPQMLDNGSYILPPASFTMSKKDKVMLCEVLKSMKFPKGYASNISRCVHVSECKIMGLKSHDCHILIEDILPIALSSCAPSDEVMHIIVEISHFLKSICAKVINPNELEVLQNRIVLTLCQMEITFLPSFFTIMVHLLVHLAEEVKLGGPVQYRWMYPFERFFLVLKDYVGNKAQPEGSIAEGYIAEEGISFCSKYLEVSRFEQKSQSLTLPINEQGIAFKFCSGGTPSGKILSILLDEKSAVQAHRYVLRHCDNIISYRERFKDGEKRKRRRHTHLTSSDLENLVNERFHDWLKQTVLCCEDQITSNEVKALAKGPNKIARTFKGYAINGYNFHTTSCDQSKKTQNYGVINTTEIGSFNYYGKIKEILEINYSDLFKVVLFKCEWANTTSTGIKEDQFGNTLVNFSRLIHTGEKLEHDPFVFSSQVEPVFYIQNPKNTNWNFVVRLKPRDVFDSNITRASEM